MGKGAATRGAILDQAVRLASEVGFDALTIGVLAERTGLSKSGLFAHFGAKDALQLAVLEHSRELFVARVVSPARAHARGVPRLRALMERWLAWTDDVLPGGCPFLTASVEFDDRPGPVRDMVVAQQREWLEYLRAQCRRAVEAGQLPAGTDPGQLTQELVGVAHAAHYYQRLLRDVEAPARARRALDRLLGPAERIAHPPLDPAPAGVATPTSDLDKERP